MRPILFRIYRSEKDDFDRGDGDMIEAIVRAREACGGFCRNFDRRVAARGWSDGEVSGGVV